MPIAAPARAACNLIPSATQSFRGALGSTDRPFAGPGEFVDVRLRPGVCDGTSGGLGSADPAEYAVTLAFVPPADGPRNVVVLATDCTGVGTCAGAASTVCVTAAPGDLTVTPGTPPAESRLRFRFPDTDARCLGGTSEGKPCQRASDCPGGSCAADNNDHTLTGPVRIAVTQRALPAAPPPVACGLVGVSCSGQSGLLACVDELYERDGSCRAILDPTFGHFTALPPPNRYETVCTEPAFPVGPCLGTASEVRVAVDTVGNVLVPVDWQGILVRAANVPVPRLLRAASSVDALSLATGPVRIPGQEFVASFTPEGAPLPPIFLPQVDPSALNEVTLFGSADAPHTVLRVARKSPTAHSCLGGTEDGRPCTVDAECGGGTCVQATCLGGPAAGQACDDDQFDCPGGECGPALFEFRDRMAGGVGPVLIPRSVLTGSQGVCETGAHEGGVCTVPTTCAGGAACVDYRVEARNPVPLEGLAGTPDVFTFSVSEAIANADLNGDTDKLDLVLTFQDRETGQSIPIGEGCPAPGCPEGRAIAAIHQPPFAFPALATEGDVVAFLEPEVAQDVDTNQNHRDFDTVLRVYRRSSATTAVSLTGSQVITAEASPVIDGRSLAVSSGRVFFRASEPAGAEQATERVSVSSSGGEPDGESGMNRATAGDSSWQSFSADGRYVAFDSAATDLTDTPPTFCGMVACRQIYVRDRDLDGNGVFDEPGAGATTTVRVSVATAGDGGGNSPSLQPSISADGRHVAFFSRATTLVSPCAGCGGQVYVHDRDADGNGVFDEPDAPGVPKTHTALVSVNSAGTTANTGSFAPAISGNGRFVAFLSAADNLLPGGTDTNNTGPPGYGVDVFVHDRDADGNGAFDETGAGDRATEGVSVTPTGSTGNGPSHFTGSSDSVPPSISHDGDWIAFHSQAIDLVPNDANGPIPDVFLRDRRNPSMQTTRIACGNALYPRISSNGRFVACVTGGQVFVHDLQTGSVTAASVGYDGASPNGAAWYPAISTEGRFVVFTSTASNLVPNDTNAQPPYGADVFVRDLLTATTMRANVTSAGLQAPVGFGNPFSNESPIPAISPDGRWVAFWHDDPLLAADDTAAVRDVYVRGPGSVGTDLTGDGALDDVVLGALDAAAATPPLMLCPATRVAVAGGAVAFLRPEVSGATTAATLPSCPLGTAVAGGVDLNGDAVATDEVVHYWPGSGPVQNLGLAATAVALNDTHAAAIAGTVRVRSLAGGFWADTGQAADTIGFCGSVLALLTPESAQGAVLNTDGLQDDRVLQLYDPATGVVINTGHAAEEFVCNAGQAAFRTSEAAQGGNLNGGSGDTDTADDVLQIYDLARPECLGVGAPADCLINTAQAVWPCGLEACDPRVPYRVGTDTIKFLTFECDQGGAVTSPGCPTGGTELNGDVPPDAADLVIQSYNVRTGTRTTIGTVLPDATAGSNPLGGEAPEGGAADSSTVYVSSGRCVEVVGGGCSANWQCDNGGFCDGGTCKRDQGTCVTADDCPPGATCVDDPIVPASPDTDADGVPDHLDDCPRVANADQLDDDGDGVGNVCDAACGSGGDAKDKVKVKTINGIGLVSGKLTIPLAGYQGEPVAVRLDDADSAPIVEETLAAVPPSGLSGKKWLYRTTTDGLQKILLIDLAPGRPGFFRIKIKGKRWFTAAQANRPAGETTLTVLVGDRCFSHVATTKLP